MPQSRCHILLNSPTAPLAGLTSGDRVVDHRISTADRPLTASDFATAVSFERTDVDARVYHDAARDAYIEWIAQVGDRELGGGESLKTLLAYRDQVSLWWFLPMQVKHYVLHLLPQLFQQVQWLHVQAEHGIDADTFLGADHRVIIYADKHEQGRIFCEALRTILPVTAGFPVTAGHEVQILQPDGEPHPPRSRWQPLYDRVGEKVRPLLQRGGFELLSAWRRLRGDGAAASTRSCDVVLVTGMHSWEEVNGAYKHRYLSDVPERLTRAGLDVVWLPRMTGCEEWSEYAECLAAQAEPVDMPRPEEMVLASARAASGVAAVQQRYRRRREELVGHPALRWGDLDLSGWILTEIDTYLRGQALYWMQAFELLSQQLQRLSAKSVLYRDEFYSLGRVVGAAAAGKVQTLAYQHGAIPYTHWVYQHDGRDVRDDDDVVRGLPRPDMFLAYSTFVRELMTAKTYPPERVAVVGSLRHDVSFERAAQVTSKSRRELREQLELPAEQPIFVICAQLAHSTPGWIELLVEGLRDTGTDGYIVVKPHWNHRNIEQIHNTFAALEWSDYRIYEGDLDALLIASDVNLTGSSTTAMEAAILHTPVICYLNEQPWEPIPYVEDGLALPARDRESMAQAVEQVMSATFRENWPHRRARFLEKHLNNIIEPSVDALCRMLAESVESP
jgi:hypothetical protein